MAEGDTERPLVQMMHLLIGHERGDYELAANAQRQLANLGWHVSRKPPEQSRPTRQSKARGKDGAS
jgi:hypothetical protein